MSKVKDLYIRKADGTLEKTKALEGLSAYDSAVIGGYAKTETEFYQDLGDMATNEYVDGEIDDVKFRLVAKDSLDGTSIYIGDDNKVHSSSGDIVSKETRYTVNQVFPTIVEKEFVRTNGSVTAHNNFNHTDKISVNKGDIVSCLARYQSYSSRVLRTFRFVCAYDSDGNVLESKGAENTTAYTVPDGVDSVILSYTSADFSDEIFRITSVEELDTVSDKTVNTKVNTFVNGGNIAVKNIPSVSANSEVFIEEIHVAKNKSMSFKAKIGTDFDSVYIGHGYQKYNGTYLLIDDTNIELHEYTTSDNVVSTTPHGLTISDFLFVNIKVGNDGKASVTVMSKDGWKKLDNLAWNGKNGSPFVLPNNCSLTNVQINWQCDDFSKLIWAYGDSYFGFTYDNRWVYYLLNSGYDNVLIDGYSGRMSKHASESFETALNHGVPKYVIWCMGMNDPDNESDINVNWVVGRDEMLALCDRYNVTPIFATIPSVPTRNHSFKNAWVKNSGYRYIDFEKSVGADINTSWYSGMLSDDGVHPTSLGAKALYMQAIVDVPELMQNNK